MSSENTRLLESINQWPAKEYRIQDGKVEVRTLDFRTVDCGYGQEDAWSELTPQQVSCHVMHNTQVARWLERKLGWRRLLQVCVGEQTSEISRDGVPEVHPIEQLR